MPSPFPGMDPYIEGQVWKDFHNRLLVAIADVLAPEVSPRYVVRVDERVYFQPPSEAAGSFIEPDVFLVPRESAEVGIEAGTRTAVATAIAPVIVPLPVPVREREGYLTIRDRETSEVITVIEVLSPTNKRAGSRGRQIYLRKRAAVLDSTTHLVELDLLRGGARLPTLGPLPPADYYAFVSRTQMRPNAEVFPWTLHHSLPTVPVPLSGDGPDIALDLALIFTALYDRAVYRVGLNYQAPVEPPLSEADEEWLAEILQDRSQTS